MSYFAINGVESSRPIPDDQTLGALLEHLRIQSEQEGRLVSAIRLEGVEIGEREEREQLGTPLSLLDRIEVDVRTSRELAMETLEALAGFAWDLADLCESDSLADLSRLIDGLTVFSDSLSTCRSILGREPIEQVDALERELAATLGSMLEAMSSAESLRALKTRLSSHLSAWSSQGIPALLRT